MKTIKRGISIFAIALLGGVASLSVDHYFYQKDKDLASESHIRNITPVKFTGFSAALPEANNDFVSAAQKAVPSVVYIEAKMEVEGQRNYNSLLDFFYGPSQPMEGEVSGSGVVVSADGYIVTNNHVIDHAGDIHVVMSNKKSYTAKLIGRDPASDLALLKIDAHDLPFAEYGNSDDLKVGQWVLAVGNPYYLTSTVTAGIVSAKGRSIDLLPQEYARHKGAPIESYIQTDAAVNPGNSGGALVNTNGQLVGINCAIASNTGSYTGYSFAIPANLVRKVVADLLQYGDVKRAFIGVNIKEMNEDMAKEAGLNSLNGVYVDSPVEGGAAMSAGIKHGDIILKVGDQEVNDVAGLEEQVGNYRPGDNVTLTVSRDGKEMEIPVTLRNIDGGTALNEPAPDASVKSVSALGAQLAPVSDDEMQKLHIDGGAQVTQLNAGTLAEIGVKKGFIITKIDHQKISSPEDVKSILNEKSGGVLVEGVYPNGVRSYYAFGM